MKRFMLAIALILPLLASECVFPAAAPAAAPVVHFLDIDLTSEGR